MTIATRLPVIGATLAAVAIALAPSPARAQGGDDVRIRVRVDVADEIVREVTREIGRGIRDVVRVVSDPQLSRLVEQAIREAMEGGFEQGGRGAQTGSGNRNFRAEQTARETRTLQLGANGSLELRNLSGDITVTAGSGRDVVVEIIRRSRGRTEEDAKLGLQRVNATVDQRGDRAVVEARYESATNAPYSVDVNYQVTAPAGVSIRLNSMSGDATVRGMKGDISAEVMSGNIGISGAARISKAHTFSGDVTLTDIDTADALTAGTISGDVLLQRVKARRVDIDVTSGDITANELSSEGATLKSLSGTIEFASTVAKGGRYELQAHSGDIHFTPTGGAGYELQISTFNGDIRIEPGIEVKGATPPGTRPRRSMRGTVGDGSAIVIATTFSGDVVVGKKR
ncbi:MAG TPA: DUF4097 family beta strand repeat-containing protein [Vicinamibacterales bacterium]|nr:DUF4097 family beta strand repeat-containing protein [Vicinamibacterales bacterium]